MTNNSGGYGPTIKIIPYLLYLYAFAVCISISVTHIVFSLIVILFLIDWWKTKSIGNVQKDFSLFAAIYGWKGITLLANGLIMKVYRIKEIWYKMPYLVIGRYRISGNQLNKILHILFIINSLLVVYAVLQEYLNVPEIYYPLFENSSRMRGYLENPNYYAGHMAIALMICLALTLFYRSGFLIYIPFLLSGLIMSGSRSYFAVCILAVLLLAYIKSRKAFMLISSVIPLFLIIGFSIFPMVSNRMSSALINYDLFIRMSYWFTAWDVYKDHALFGVGFKEFFINYIHSYVSKEIVPFEGNAHNLYMQELVEGGPIGLLLVIFVMSYFVRKYYLSFSRSDDQLFSAMSLGISISFLALMMIGITEAHFEFPALWLLLTFLMGICEAYRNGLNPAHVVHSTNSS